MLIAEVALHRHTSGRDMDPPSKRQPVGEEVDKGPDTRRHRRAAHEYRMDQLDVAGIIVFQERHQPPLRDRIHHTEPADTG